MLFYTWAWKRPITVSKPHRKKNNKKLHEAKRYFIKIETIHYCCYYDYLLYPSLYTAKLQYMRRFFFVLCIICIIFQFQTLSLSLVYLFTVIGQLEMLTLWYNFMIDFNPWSIILKWDDRCSKKKLLISTKKSKKIVFFILNCNETINMRRFTCPYYSKYISYLRIFLSHFILLKKKNLHNIWPNM